MEPLKRLRENEDARIFVFVGFGYFATSVEQARIKAVLRKCMRIVIASGSVGYAPCFHQSPIHLFRFPIEVQ